MIWFRRVPPQVHLHGYDVDSGLSHAGVNRHRALSSGGGRPLPSHYVEQEGRTERQLPGCCRMPLLVKHGDVLCGWRHCCHGVLRTLHERDVLRLPLRLYLRSGEQARILAATRVAARAVLPATSPIGRHSAVTLPDVDRGRGRLTVALVRGRWRDRRLPATCGLARDFIILFCAVCIYSPR